MNRKGPFITLIGGLVTAGVLVGLSMNATAQEQDAIKQDNANAAAANEQGNKPADKPAGDAGQKPEEQVEQIEASYAGEVEGGQATIAVAVKDGQAVAYLCDGNKIEAWMKGEVSGRDLKLTGKDGASLTGTYDEKQATGNVAAAGKEWEFTAGAVEAPAGLYRATGRAAGDELVAGWIRREDGSQVGIATVNGNPTGAPPLSADGRATVNGTELTAAPVSGDTEF